jgi:cysteine desulfuration protein SufE
MTKFDEIRADFEFLDEWDDRYKYLIDLGRNLAPYPEEFRDNAHKVKGCASQVWLHAQEPDGDGALVFTGDSDAHIVKGLIALLIALYSGRQAADIAAIDPTEALKPFDLEDHLTPQRSNGLNAMVKRMTAIAAQRAAKG